MSSSFEKINYNLRPNKSIERKMMCEALQRLSFLDYLENYRYIGFGSAYFTDFVLFHKNLGITDLISIEKEESKKKRFEFNIPFSGIKMEYGNSSTILPNLQLGLKKSIVWVDYDDRISDFMFSDIDSFFTEAATGSFFILSVNVEQEHPEYRQEDDSPKQSIREFRLEQLINRIGKERIPNEYMSHNMTTKNLIAVVYEMINRQIAKSLLVRNGNKKSKVYYKQVFNFVYSDNATILTIGGIIHDRNQIPKIKKMAFQNLSFTVANSKSYKIQSPNLTVREIKALDKLLPGPLEFKNSKFTNTKVQEIPLIPTDIQKYERIYRYFPNFTEINL